MTVTASFTAEQREMRSVLRAALADASSVDTSHERVWQTLTGELGLAALLVPTKRDGLGLGPVELLVVAEELGRALRAGDFLTTGVLGAALLADLATAPADDLLARLVTGRLRTAVLTDAVAEVAAGVPGQRCPVTLGAGPVPGADQADILLVPGRAGAQPVLVAVDPASSGVTLAPVPCLDDTRGFAAVTLAAATGTIVAAGDHLPDRLAQAMTLARLYLAGEAGGGASWCLEAATEYATLRTQFGRPIGSFQAIKHLCADLLVDVQGCKSMSRLAAAQVETGAPEAALDVDLALLHAAGAFDRVARGAMHVFGGIGFTWEHPAHRYVKRALTVASLLEPEDRVRARVAARVHSRPPSPKEA